MPISINCMYLWVKAPHMTSSRKSDLTCSLDITGMVRGDPGSTTSCLDSLVVLVLEPCGAGEDGAVGGDVGALLGGVSMSLFGSRGERI